MRIFLRFTVLSVLIISSMFTSCRKEDPDADGPEFDRTSLLTDLTLNVIVPNYVQLEERTAALLVAAQTFIATPQQNTLEELRSEWNASMDQWAQCEAFRFGYAFDTGLNSQIAEWPTNGPIIEQEILASYPLDEAYIASTGTTRKGLFAVEYLIYSTTANDQQIIENFTSDPTMDRRANYLLAVCSHINTRCVEAANYWNVNASTFISNTQNDISGSLNLAVNAWIEHIEFVRRAKVQIPAGIETGQPAAPEACENFISKRSLKSIRYNIQNWQSIFSSNNGIGLAENLNSLSARYQDQPLEDVINSTLSNIIDQCDALDIPLEEAVIDRPDDVAQLYLELKRLTVLTKVDMSSQLGVIITFSDNDGD